MKISAKGRYAIRMMLDLALHNTGDSIPLNDISVRENIPLKNLEQTASILLKAGLLNSTRGKKGGYTLSKAPKNISVYDILSLTENMFSHGAHPEVGCGTCDRYGQCCISDMWAQYTLMSADFFSQRTLEDLVRNQIKKQRRNEVSIQPASINM